VTATAGAAEIAVLGLGLGLALSLICYLVTNLSPGGMITPGWLAITLIADARQVAVIVLVSALTWASVVVLQRVVILFGKRLFATVVLVGLFLQVTAAALWHDGGAPLTTHETLGFIVPGLVAYQLVRQPRLPTIVATVTVTGVSTTVLVIGILLRLLPQ
jgi:gamma-polyglutamate biosynthesis protein CapC